MSAGKHAYLILAHTCPGQLRKLLSLLDDPRNDLFIHIDRKASFGPEALEGCCRHSKLSFVEPRISVHWGGISIMHAELALLRAAVPGGYAFYHLLSGQDLPIKPQDAIHAFFAEHADREFINYWQFKPTPRICARVEKMIQQNTMIEGIGYLPNEHPISLKNVFKG